MIAEYTTTGTMKIMFFSSSTFGTKTRIAMVSAGTRKVNRAV